MVDEQDRGETGPRSRRATSSGVARSPGLDRRRTTLSGKRRSWRTSAEPYRYTMADLDGDRDGTFRTIRYYITEGLLLRQAALNIYGATCLT